MDDPIVSQLLRVSALGGWVHHFMCAVIFCLFLPGVEFWELWSGDLSFLGSLLQPAQPLPLSAAASAPPPPSGCRTGCCI